MKKIFLKKHTLPILLLLFTLSCGKKSYQDIRFGKPSGPVLNKKFNNRDLGFLLYDPRSDTVLSSHQRQKTRIPASVSKIPTTAAALHLLGENFRFKTELSYQGTIRKGTLYGDLLLKGYGDPFLHAGDLMQMTSSLKKLRITNIRGRFFYDDSYLMRTQSIDRNMDMDAAYNPGVSALSSGYNSISAFWKKSSYNRKTSIFLTPTLSMYSVRPAKKIAWKTTRFSLDQKRIWTLRSRYKMSGRKRLPVKDPSRFTALTLAYLCNMQGIRLPVPIRSRNNSGFTLLHQHKSLPLIRLVDITLDYSDNLMAELILLAAVKKLGSQATSLKQAGAALAHFYTSRMKQICWKGLHLANGSGLSPETRVSPEQMLAFLRFALRQPVRDSHFQNLLPASGISYSLLYRLNRPDTAMRVWAKTGTIFYAVTMTGVLYTRTGRRLLFSVMFSDNKKREQHQRLVQGKSREKTLKKAIQWVRSRKKKINSLIRFWIKNF